eukprot:scaffold97578_cov25-Cyclotella_meneghiniana.AAC.3
MSCLGDMSRHVLRHIHLSWPLLRLSNDPDQCLISHLMQIIDGPNWCCVLQSSHANRNTSTRPC